MDDKIQRRGLALFLISFGAVLLVALGSLFYTDHFSRPFIEDLYRSVGLFTGNGSWAFDASAKPPPPVIFKLLAVLAPLVSALGLVELVTGRAWSDWLRLKSGAMVLLRCKQPTAIFGLTPDSIAFARSLLAPGSDDLPVIFDPQPAIALMNRCDDEGIPVFTLLPRQNGYLWSTCRRLSPRFIAEFLLLRAPRAVSFLTDPDDQISLVQALDPWLRHRRIMRRDIWLLMTQRGLRQRLDSYLKFSHQTLRLRFFDFYSLAARQLLHKHQLDQWADILGQGQIHLAIYGFGRLGRAIAKEAARYYVTRASIAGPHRKLRLTIIDAAPEEALAAFRAEEPEIEKVLEIETIAARLQTGGFTEEQLRQAVPAQVTAHIITLNEPEWVVAQALSLRRWLLEPPGDVDEAWLDSHRNAPIFIPVDDWSGLGSLVRSGVDWPTGVARKPEVPDAIFGFGNTDELLHHTWVLAKHRDAGAKVLHEGYQTHMLKTDADRPGVTAWADLAPNLRLSNLLAFDHIWVKARAAGYRILPIPTEPVIPFWARETPAAKRADPAPVATSDPVFDPDTALFLSQLEHARYVAERVSEGWRYAETRCDTIRVHHLLRDWADIGLAEQKIDEELIGKMPAALKAIGKRFVKAHIVGIVGHRLPDARDPHPAHPRMEEMPVRAALRRALRDILGQYPGTVLLSALATGADTWAVEEAKVLGIPWIVVLPLPYELYGEDFSDDAEGPRQPGVKSWDETFRALVAEAEYYFELPLIAGRASAMSRPQKNPMTEVARKLRAAQYDLAGRVIVERSDTLLAVWDGEAAQGLGGTGDLVARRSHLAAGALLPSSSAFFARPKMTEPVKIPCNQ